MLGVVHSAIIYFFPLFVFKNACSDQEGRGHTFYDHSLHGVLTVLIVQYYIIFQDTFLYSKSVIIPHAIQIVHNILFIMLYAKFGSDQLGAYTFDIIGNFKFWFVLLITLAIDLLFVIISRKIDILFLDSIRNNLRNRRFEHDYTKKIYIKKLEHMSKCTRSLAKFKKIYKQIDQYQAENYADKKMKEIVEMYKKNKINNMNIIANSPVRHRINRSKSHNLEKELKEKLKTINIKIQNTIKKRESSSSNKNKSVIKIFTNERASNQDGENIRRFNSTKDNNLNLFTNNIVMNNIEEKLHESENYDIEMEVPVYDDIEAKIIQLEQMETPVENKENTIEKDEKAKEKENSKEKIEQENDVNDNEKNIDM